VVAKPLTGNPKTFRVQTGTILWLLNIYRALTRLRNFAENVGIKFHTPEEYFLGEAPREFTRTFEHSEYIASTTEGKGKHLSSQRLANNPH